MIEYVQDIGRGLWFVAKMTCVLIPVVALEFFYPQVFIGLRPGFVSL